MLFRDPAVPKGSLNVMVVDGVVELRGEADPETMRRLEEQARGIAGVRDVRNLVHAPRRASNAAARQPAEELAHGLE